MNIADFVDLDRYPIDRDCQSRKDLLTSAQALIEADGCAVLKGFVRPKKLSSWLLNATELRNSVTEISLAQTHIF